MTTATPARKRLQIDPQALRAARLAAGFTQERLARKAGIAAITVSRIERGANARAEQESVRRLARALGVPMAQLLVPPG